MAPLLPTLAAHARSIFSSATTARSQAVQTASEHLSQLGPLAARAILLGRDDDDKDDKDKSTDPQILDPSKGVTDPNNINNTFIFILFGLIGAALVVTGIWFFFWAKNGGFVFKEDDWEEYKSTVLRRKGPNGTILSNATPSTNLGGGSVYKDVDDGSTEYTGGLTQISGDTGDTVSTLTGITAGASDIAGRERRRRAREKKEREHEKKRDRKNRKSRRKVGEDGVLVDEDAEEEAKRNLRAYRAERAARVGGINKEAEGSEWDGSTNPEMSTISGSELLLHNRQSTPTSTPSKDKEREREKRKSRAADYHDTATEMSYDTATSQTQSQAPPPAKTSAGNSNTRKAGGIRKVYSTADRTSSRENERLRAEARRLAEKGRAAAAAAGGSSSASQYSSRRDFSYQRADLRGAGSAITEEVGETGSLMGGADITTAANTNRGGAGAGRYLLPAPAEAEEDEGTGDIADSDLGTKSYRHYIPGLSSSTASGSGAGSAVGSSVADGSDYTEDRRERRRRRDAERAARASRRN